MQLGNSALAIALPFLWLRGTLRHLDVSEHFFQQRDHRCSKFIGRLDVGRYGVERLSLKPYPHCGDANVGSFVEFSHYLLEMVHQIARAILK